MSNEVGVIKLQTGGFFIKGLGRIVPPTGVTLVKKGGLLYWQAKRKASKYMPDEVDFFQLARIESAEQAWYAYRAVVKALHDHVEYLYTGRHFVRFEHPKKKTPTGQVGVSVCVTTSGGTAIYATFGREKLSTEVVFNQIAYRNALSEAISVRVAREKEWLKEHVITLAQALDVIDDAAKEGKRIAKSKNNTAARVGA